MIVLDLFSGVGAFSLGLERAGFRTCAFVEIDPYCRRVLAKHWPEVPQYHDIRELTADRLHADGIFPDVICGGFPCQDISVAGRGVGIDGERSGLWSEFARLIGELRPRYALIENVAALVGRGLERVLCDLAALGFDAEWRIISAADMGAPHRRERVWIVAYPAGARRGDRQCEPGGALRDGARGAQPERLGGDVADANGHAWDIANGAVEAGCAVVAAVAGSAASGGIGAASRADVADAGSGRCDGPGGGEAQFPWRAETVGASEAVADANDRLQPDVPQHAGSRLRLPQSVGCWGDAWRVEPDMGRVAHGVFEGLDQTGIADPWAGGEWPGVPRVAKGVPDRVSRLRALGNSLVPQIPEMLGRAILAREAAA